MRRFFTIMAVVILTASIWAQSPQKMSYQAVIRNNSDQLVTNHAVGMRISILQSSATGTVVYTETQTPTTNDNGLVSIEIGGGVGFDAINWASDIYFIKTETDPAGGTSYTITGTSQLLSVPYALHAKTVANYPETDPVFVAHAASGVTSTLIGNWTTAYGWGNHASAGYLTSFTELDPVFIAHAANGITSTNITNWNSAYGWGNHLDLYRPIGYVPAWSEITSNPFSFVSPVNNQLLKYNSTSSKFENWAPNFLTTEVDGSITNEIQTLSLSTNQLSILGTGGNTVTFTNWDTDNTDDVTTTGNQTIAGNKTFSGTTTVINPVNANDAATKAYVDKMLSIIQTIQTGVRDIDGNTYKVILIGNQLWMSENLKAMKYNDGTAIPNITDNTAWAALTTGAYCDYSNTPSNSTTYGRLYNWYAVDNNASTKVASNGGKNVCPTGWHVPTDAEWTTLTDYLTNNGYGYGGSGSDIGKSMASTSGWTTYGTAGTVGNDQASNNSSGFTVLPSGYRNGSGTYYLIGYAGYWWSSTDYSTSGAFSRYMGYDSSSVYRGNGNKHFGFSVRCLRD